MDPDASHNALTHLAMAELLQTNEPPSALQETQLRSHLHRETAKLAAIREEHQRVQEALSSLQKSVDDHRAVLSPIRRLPVEILGEVMLYGRDNHTIFPNNPGRKLLSEAPWVFTHVSSRWRSVANNLAVLWGTISIPLEGQNGERPHLLKALTLALERSQCTPLHITCTLHGKFSPELLKTILSVSRRWRHLILTTPSSLYPLFQEVKHAVPLLERLELYNDDDPHHLLPLEFGDWLVDAPRLQRLRLFRFDLPLETCPIPWKQITSFSHLGTGEPLRSEEVEQLRRLTNLKEYDTGYWLQDGSGLERLTPIPLHNLQKLVITPDDESLLLLLPLLDTPNIETLEWGIGVSQELAIQTGPMVRRIAQAASNTLTDLTVTVETNDEILEPGNIWPHVVDVLAASDKTKTFEVTYMDDDIAIFNTAFLRYLIVTHDTDSEKRPLLPHLENLTIKVDDNDDHYTLAQSKAMHTAVKNFLTILKEIIQSREEILWSFELVVNSIYFLTFRRVFCQDVLDFFADEFPHILFKIDIYDYH